MLVTLIKMVSKEKLEILRDAEYIEKEVRERYQEVITKREDEGWEASRDLLMKLVASTQVTKDFKSNWQKTFSRLEDIDNAIKVLEPIYAKDKPFVRALNLYGRCLLKK